MTWKNRKRLAMVRIQLRKTLKYLLHVGFTVDQTLVSGVWFFFSLGLISLNLRLGLCQICGVLVESSEYLRCSEVLIDSTAILNSSVPAKRPTPKTGVWSFLFRIMILNCFLSFC